MELVFFVALLAAAGLVALGLLKLLLWMVVLPFKIGFWILQGVVTLVFLVPFLILSACAVSVVLPIVFGVIAIPVVAVVIAIVALVRLIA